MHIRSLSIRPARLALPLFLLSLTLSCGGGGSTGEQQFGGEFKIIATEPENGSRIFLNEGLRVRFSQPFDLGTVNFNSVAFTVRDASGNPVSEQVVGRFSYGRSGDDQIDRTLLVFDPALPSNDRYDNGGFRPGREYIVSFSQGTQGIVPQVRDLDGRRLSDSSPIKSLSFRTRSGSTSPELFRDREPNGPTVLRVNASPLVGNRVLLGEFGSAPTEFEIEFDQPLDPASTNVRRRDGSLVEPKSILDDDRIHLEYDDPEYGKGQRIRVAVSMPRNDNGGARVVLRPLGLLPSQAQIRVVIDQDFQDLAGQNNRNTIGYDPVVAVFETESALTSRIDGITLRFAEGGMIDEEAAFADPVAEILSGRLSPSFEFEGGSSPFDWFPSSKLTILNTVRQQVTPVQGAPFTSIGGVFQFRDVTIPAGVQVAGSGPNPLVFLATGTVRIDGHLAADGGDGQVVNVVNSANVPVAGGPAGCGGGKGGKGSQNASNSTQRGENGFGPGQRRNAGGEGGGIGCSNALGSGGGGGSMATQGDSPHYGNTNARTRGTGGRARGGKPGPTLFDDPRNDNDFWGRGLTPDGQLVIGELKTPTGGSGGGGGGDQTSAGPNANGECFRGATGFLTDNKGAGGGGGGGVLVVKALGPILVGPQGRVSADGGWGAGGAWINMSSRAGGGGGGSGGMVVLMSATRIEFEARGGNFEAPSWDAQFAITADGNVGGDRARLNKYLGAGSWNAGSDGAGGHGGMGIVQLMVPPGSDADGTGTRLDDYVQVRQGAQLLNGAAKTARIMGGDIRPVPKLLPVPFSRYSQARTRWIDTGASKRREASSGARAMQGGLPGPEYYFAGLHTTGPAAGYLKTDTSSGLYAAPEHEFPGSLKRAQVLELVPSSGMRRGVTVHEVRLAPSLLPADGSLAQQRLRLHGTSDAVLGEFRIIDHDGERLYLDASEGKLPNGADQCSIVRKFFEVVTEGTEGLGRIYERQVGQTTERHPIANVQFGFAFHLDPSMPDLATSNGKRIDRNRFPQDLEEFLHDLETPSARETLRKLQFPFAKVMVRFNRDFEASNPAIERGALDPDAPQPQLNFIVLPYRY